MTTAPRFLAVKILLPVAVIAAVTFLLLPRSGSEKTAEALRPSPPKPTGEIVIDFPPSWSEIPGKLSRTYRSPRPGAGLLQLSVHPPLASKTDGAGAQRELDTLLREMVTEMEFGERVWIGHFETKAGPLAFAKYRSPKHGVLGFWLLSAEPMIFATYVDGGTGTAEKDIAEGQQAFLNAHFERP